MAAQTNLIPSLFALHSPTSLPLLLSRLSLQALYIQPHHIRDDIYLATTSVIPGQLRSLRLRAERRTDAASKAKGKGKAKAVEADGEADEGQWEYSMTYLSPPLNGREYAEMSVRACVGLEVAGESTRKDIEGFIQVLGFKHSHSYTRSGYLIHLPLPLPSATPLTLHLSITRLRPTPPPPSGASEQEQPAPPAVTGPMSEPYLLTLQPSRAVPAVSQRGEPGLEDMMRVMREVADRIEGVQWETGRA